MYVLLFPVRWRVIKKYKIMKACTLTCLLLLLLNISLALSECSLGTLENYSNYGSFKDIQSNIHIFEGLSNVKDGDLKAFYCNANNEEMKFAELAVKDDQLYLNSKNMSGFEQITPSSNDLHRFCIKIKSLCNNFEKNIIFYVNDTNNHFPSFVNSQMMGPVSTYVYNIPIPLPPEQNLEPYGSKIWARDFDISNTEVTFRMEPNEYLKLEYKAAVQNYLNKVYEANLILIKIPDFDECVFQIYVTDSGDPPNTSDSRILFKKRGAQTRGKKNYSLNDLNCYTYDSTTTTPGTSQEIDDPTTTLDPSEETDDTTTTPDPSQETDDPTTTSDSNQSTDDTTTAKDCPLGDLANYNNDHSFKDVDEIIKTFENVELPDEDNEVYDCYANKIHDYAFSTRNGKSLSLHSKNLDYFEETNASSTDVQIFCIGLNLCCENCYKKMLKFTLIDTNNHSPYFVDDYLEETNTFCYDVPMPFNPGMEIGLLGSKLWARDVDISNVKVIFSIEPNEDFKIEYKDIVNGYLNKVHEASLVTLKALNFNLREYKITVTDTGVPPRRANATVVVRKYDVCKQKSQEFSKIIYEAEYTENTLEIFLSEKIILNNAKNVKIRIENKEYKHNFSATLIGDVVEIKITNPFSSSSDKIIILKINAFDNINCSIAKTAIMVQVKGS